MDIKQVNNLLEKTSIIKKKYDEIAEYTGENFNVFNILGLDEKELVHSSFISNLLNVRAGHGQKDVFLKLFIEEIKDLFLDSEVNRETLQEFESFKSSTSQEEYVGAVDYERGEGGRIDIVIKDGVRQILIENKIGAQDEESQLLRYNKAYSSAPIIYLTPFGGSPSDNSKRILIENRDFICISYEHHIVNWIKKCIKEMANKPIIRETLIQYLYLVKQITNQTRNDKMEQELAQLIIKNKSAAKTFLEGYNVLKNKLTLKVEELHNLISQSTDVIKNLTFQFGFDEELEIGKPYTDAKDKVRIFTISFKKIKERNRTFIIEIHENHQMNFTININIFSGDKSIYNNEIDRILKREEQLQPKEYEYNTSNEEIVKDITSKIEVILRCLSN